MTTNGKLSDAGGQRAELEPSGPPAFASDLVSVGILSG